MANDEYISGEEHKAMVSTKKHQIRKVKLQPWQLTIGIVIIVAISFYGGTLYGQHHQPKASAATTTAANGSGVPSMPGQGGRRFGGGQRGAFGKVTAISASSITIANQRTNKDSTLSITDQTMITNDGQTASASDIQVGDTVVVIASTSNSSEAARIMLNPSFGGGAQGANPSTDSNSGQSPTQLN